ncbi:DNA-binding LytR/AlgR family response regulator [Arcicella rosea]|uniref:LytR/AlgR family response regulator transcription factor n=1 Tax=Arcicella rosea TaxID=502909 RepID=UPI00345D5A73
MENKITCLIVDDEPIARQIIEKYCSHLPEIELLASCENVFVAKKVLESQTVDLLFLDINMPVLDGIAFLKTLKNPPSVIFTTAYKEFALDAFDLSAIDYLLKPFSLDRFIIAVDKVKEKLALLKQPSVKLIEETVEDFTFIKADGKIHKVDFGTLLYAEAKGNNVLIVSENQTIFPVMTFSDFLALLSNQNFLRLHRSFVINKSKISHVEGNRVFIGKTEIPIGGNYRLEFLKSLGISN